jgi:NADH:ubiquinone oxidoreductase subunit 6 (subunit J)
MLDSVIFWTFAIIAVIASFGAVVSRSAIYAALCLIAVFMSIAGFYVLNNADFLAMAQVIIYAVGLTILMLFAIMFTGDKPVARSKVNRTARLAYGIIASYVFCLLIRAVVDWPGPHEPLMNATVKETLARQGSTEMLGTLLFGQYALPFELASILLLVAMIGAIVIAKKQFLEPDNPSQPAMGDTQFRIDLASAPEESALEALRQQHFETSSAHQPVSLK